MPQFARYFGIEIDSDGNPDGEALATAVSERVMITIQLADSWASSASHAQTSRNIRSVQGIPGNQDCTVGSIKRSGLDARSVGSSFQKRQLDRHPANAAYCRKFIGLTLP
jgi:hypothetical protein